MSSALSLTNPLLNEPARLLQVRRTCGLLSSFPPALNRILALIQAEERQ